MPALLASPSISMGEGLQDLGLPADGDGGGSSGECDLDYFCDPPWYV